MKSTHIVGGMAGIVGIVAVLLTLASGPENIVYEWPEGIGDSPGNPIEVPFTLDENYMVSNLGIGGCEMTIHGVVESRQDDEPIALYYLDATVRAVDDIEYCEIKGLSNLLNNFKTNTFLPFADQESLIENGEILIGIYLNLRDKHEFDPDATLYGFKLRSTYIGNAFLIDGMARDAWRYPSWSFNPSEPDEHLWFPSTLLRPSEEGYPASIELVFLDIEKVKRFKQLGWSPEYDKLYLLHKDILYSKFFEFKIYTPPDP